MYNFLGSLPSFLFFFSRQCFSVVYLGSFFMTMLEHHDQSNLLKKKCLTGFTVSKGQSSWSWSRGMVAEQLRIQNLKQRQTGHTGIFFFQTSKPRPPVTPLHTRLYFISTNWEAHIQTALCPVLIQSTNHVRTIFPEFPVLPLAAPTPADSGFLSFPVVPGECAV